MLLVVPPEDGKRCIDYFLSDTFHGTPESPAIVLSDHKVQELKLEFSAPAMQSFQLRPCPQLPAYQGDSKDWQTTVSEVWQRHKQSLPTSWAQDLNGDWNALAKVYFETLVSTHRQLNPDVLQDTPASLLRRGKPVTVEFSTQDRLRRLTAGHMATHRERVLSRLLARLHEVQRFDNLTSKSHVQTKQYMQLWKRIRRCPHYHPEVGVVRNIREIQKQLKQVTDQADHNRFGRWTEKMKQDKHAYAWLRRDAHPVASAIRSSSESTAGVSVQESLKNLKQFWSEVWQRNIPNSDDFWDELVEHTPQTQPQQSWPRLTSEQIAKAVSKAKGSAAGLDGWRPEELTQFCPDMFSTLATFFEHCENIGRLPDAWLQIRQVHLGKGKSLEKDGSCHANDLRPIAVSSIWWRVLNNTRYQQKETQEWLTSVMPAWVYGGIPGKGAQNALCPLLQAELQSWVLASLDLTKAFDHGGPRLVHKMLLRLGMPPKTANLLLYQWSNQTRYLQLLGETLPDLPQGDCWSMIGMTSLLIPITNHILNRFPNTIMTVYYADDRSYASPTPGEALEVANCWDMWTGRIGLVENHQKRQFFHRTQAGRQHLLNLGLSPSTVSDTICILGYYLVGNRQRKSAGKETIRLTEAIDRTKRARALPGTKDRLARLLRTGVAPKATWGHICRYPTKAETKRLWTTAKVIHEWPKQSSMPLVKLTVGHWWDLGFHATCTTLRMLTKHVANSHAPLHDWPNRMSGWTAALRKGMMRLGTNRGNGHILGSQVFTCTRIIFRTTQPISCVTHLEKLGEKPNLMNSSTLTVGMLLHVVRPYLTLKLQKL